MLNAGAKEGKLRYVNHKSCVVAVNSHSFDRYNRGFLLQFMSICKENLELLPLFDVIALKPIDQLSSIPSRQAIDCGLPGASMGNQRQSMRQFTTLSGKFGPDSELFEATGGPAVPFRNPPSQLTANQGGPGGSKPSHGVRSKRGKKRSDAATVGGPLGPQAHGPAFGQPQAGLSNSI